MKSIDQFSFLFFLLLIAFINANRWPSPDDFALRIQTKLVNGSKRIHIREDDFHVDFFAVTDSSNKGGNGGIVVIKYQLPDGKHVTEVFDGQNSIRFVKLVLPGEISQGQLPFQQFCFVSTLGDSDLLTADSVLRLRQKNSMAVRLSEEDRGIETIVFSYFVPTRHIPKLWAPVASEICKNVDGLYVTEEVFKEMEKTGGSKSKILHVNPSSLSPCLIAESTSPCACSIKYCLPWYPCGWKYCDENHSPVMPNVTSENAFRCGVQSCRIRRVLRFQATDISSFCDPKVDIDGC